MRNIFVVLTIAYALMLDLAHAQTLNKPECTKANIDSTGEKVDKMPDSPRKKTAQSEIASARQKSDAGQTEECQDHLLKANVQTK